MRSASRPACERAAPRPAITRAAGTSRARSAPSRRARPAAGMQQNRGTMGKSFHAGKAASNGVLAALLAERGFDATQEIIEGKKGFSRIYSDVAEPDQLTAGLGQGWMIETNGHKPYACGVVLHPLIDAVIAIRNRGAIDAASIDEISLRVNPLVLSL